VELTYDGFRDYLNRVARLHALTRSFIEYYDGTIRRADGRRVHELQEDVRSMVLGGMRPDGEYAENAYALLAKDLVGLYLEDPKLYVSKLRVGARPDVKVVVRETDFVRFVRLLNRLSGFVLSRAGELLPGGAGRREGGAERRGVEELVAELLRASYDLCVGVHGFPTSVWGLRKITPRYLKRAYGDVPEGLLSVLGFSRLWSAGGYELWGFPDYFTRCTVYRDSRGYTYMYINGVPARGADPVRPETLGGAICMLNEVVWRYSSLLRETLSRWYEGVVDVEGEYVREAWSSLSDIGWRMPDYLTRSDYPAEKLYAPFERALEEVVYTGSFRFLVYDEDGVASKLAEWVYRGSYDRSGFDERRLSRYILLPELFNDLMPAMFLGVVDVTLFLVEGGVERRALLVLVRTERGG